MSETELKKAEIATKKYKNALRDCGSWGVMISHAFVDDITDRLHQLKKVVEGLGAKYEQMRQIFNRLIGHSVNPPTFDCFTHAFGRLIAHGWKKTHKEFSMPIFR